MTVEQVIAAYRKKFGEYPRFNGSSFDEEYPIDAVLDALDTGVPIKEPDLPRGIKA